MFPWFTEFASIKDQVLYWCGLRHEIQGSQLHKTDGRFRYYPGKSIPAGWYMLAVSGQRSLLGESISVCDASGGVSNILMTAKPVIKRIVRLGAHSEWLDFTCAADLQAEQPIQASLTRISQSFAVSRMTRKLAFASRQNTSVDNISSDELYQLYTQRVDKCYSAISYEQWYQRHGKLKASQAATHSVDSGLLTIVNQPALDPEGKDQLPVNLADLISTIETDYICLLGPDVIPDEHLIPLVEQAIADNPDVWLLYPDHDIQHTAGKRQQPCFKPGWNPEMLLSGNYIGQTLIISRRLLELIGVPDARLGTSSFYGWLLRAVPFLNESRVFRIPLVLYSYSDSRLGAAAYLSTGEGDRQVLTEFLADSGYAATAEAGLIEGTYRVKWQMPGEPPSVDIIIPSKDNVAMLRSCINSVLDKTDYSNYHITVVDNGSTEAQTFAYYDSMLDESRLTVLQYDGEFNYSALNNFAVNRTKGDVLLLLNNDTEVINTDWLENLVALAARDEVGCVGAKLHYAGGQIQHAGVILGMFGMAGHAHRLSEYDDDGYCGRLKISHNVSAVTAACMAVRRSVYNQIGQLDDINLRVAYNDVDLCLRTREAGYQNIWTPHASLYHYESISRGSEDTRRKRKRFQREFAYMQKRWAIDTFVDTAYNPNLALDSEDFSIAG